MVQKYQNTVQRADGTVVGGASVLVQTYPGAVTATIYSDSGVTPQTNPLTTDALGNFSFYAADGRYQLVVSGNNIPTNQTYTDILLEDPADANNYVLSLGTAGAPSLSFASDANTGVFSPGADTIGLSTGGSERARVASTGQLLVGVTSANANGGPVQISGGVTFPATQAAASDPNTLDDYEEGSFTPSITFGGAAVGITYAVQRGTYTKIGRVVHVQGRITLTSKGSSAGGAVIAGMPFSAATDGNIGVAMTFTTRAGDLVAYGSGTGFALFQGSAGAGFVALDDTAFTNTSDLVFGGTYEV